MRTLGSAELVKEIVRLSEGPPSPATTMEMALGLGLTRNPGDLARAIGLLDPIARSNSPELALWQPWARMLLSRYAEQRRTEDQLERQNQQLRDQQRRIDQLNNQVEALKAIERSLNNRAPAAVVPAPASPPGAAGGYRRAARALSPAAMAARLLLVDDDAGPPASLLSMRLQSRPATTSPRSSPPRRALDAARGGPAAGRASATCRLPGPRRPRSSSTRLRATPPGACR